MVLISDSLITETHLENAILLAFGISLDNHHVIRETRHTIWPETR